MSRKLGMGVILQSIPPVVWELGFHPCTSAVIYWGVFVLYAIHHTKNLHICSDLVFICSSEVFAAIVFILYMKGLSLGRQITCLQSCPLKVTEPAFQTSLQTLRPVLSSLAKVSTESVLHRLKNGGKVRKRLWKFSEGCVREIRWKVGKEEGPRE